MADVIESAVTRSLCPKHLFSFNGFRLGMPGLRRDLSEHPPSAKEKKLMLDIFPASFDKMCENQWFLLDEYIYHPHGVRFQMYCHDWVIYGSECCEKDCSVFCDTFQKQKAYLKIRKRLLEEAESIEERIRIRNRNPLLRSRLPDLVSISPPVDDVHDCICCQDGKNLAIHAHTPPPPGFECKSFFYQRKGDFDDERPLTDHGM